MNSFVCISFIVALTAGGAGACGGTDRANCSGTTRGCDSAGRTSGTDARDSDDAGRSRGGTGGVSGAPKPGADGGRSGSAAGSAGKAPQPPKPMACKTTDDCGSKQVCVRMADGSANCLDGSGKACSGKDVCAHGMGFDSEPGQIEGSFCHTSSDCELGIKGHLNSVCLLSTADSGKCVTLCQYADDLEKLKCVTDPQLGIFPTCTRDQIRLVVVASIDFSCGGEQILEGYDCVPDAPPLTPADESTVECYERSFQDGSIADCDLAYMCLRDDHIDVKSRVLVYYKSVTPPPGSAMSSQCGADCDCGHCSYCESGICRYGGEGQYACFRGCE